MFCVVKKRHLFVYALLAMMLLTACGRNDRLLEYALQFADSNRGELEKVLAHYKDSGRSMMPPVF